MSQAHLHLSPDAIYPFDERGVAKRFRHAAIFGALVLASFAAPPKPLAGAYYFDGWAGRNRFADDTYRDVAN